MPCILHSKLRITLQWRHNGRDGVSNHQPHDCLLNRLFGCRSKKTSKLRVTGLCAGNSPGTGEFLAQMASNAESVSIWWRHHDLQECSRLNNWFALWCSVSSMMVHFRVYCFKWQLVQMFGIMENFHFILFCLRLFIFYGEKICQWENLEG